MKIRRRFVAQIREPVYNKVPDQQALFEAVPLHPSHEGMYAN